MRSRLASTAMALLLLPGANAQYKTALPGYRYEFPRDNFNHPEYQTEWWYTTGNVKTVNGRRFGYELTFFREGTSREETKNKTWDVRDLYLAHLALSDLDGQKFLHTERTNRPGPGLAGADQASGRIWNGNWQMRWKNETIELRAVADEFELQFSLRPEKPPVIHGENGVSQKAEGAGRASHYISFTRIATTGTIRYGGAQFEVTGSSWMDHEFFTHPLDAEQTGWDWLSLQLDDNTEMMLFRIRRRDGSIDPFSAGTFVDAAGKTTHLRTGDFTLEPLRERWGSPVTGAVYPIRWRITVPKLRLVFEVRTPLASQELVGTSKLTPNYWEGAIVIAGQRNGAVTGGTGYLEMTGYDRAVSLGKP